MSNDDIGFKKPPKATQFKKGQSGNPSGRPKGASSNRKRIRKMLEQPTPVKIGEQVKTLSTFELSLERLNEGVRKGDKSAIARVLALAREIDKDDDQKAAAAPQAATYVEPLTDEDREIILDYLTREKALKDAF